MVAVGVALRLGSIAATALPAIIKFAKSGLGKTAIAAAVSIPVTSAVGKSISNITTPLGINKVGNLEKEIDKLEATNKVLESSANANTEAISKVDQLGRGLPSQSNLISLALTAVLATGMVAGIYYLARR